MGLLAWPISSYPPPLGAGTNPRTHVRAKTSSWPAWIIPELTPGPPRRKIYAHTEGPSRGSGDRGYSRASDNLSTAR